MKYIEIRALDEDKLIAGFVLELTPGFMLRNILVNLKEGHDYFISCEDKIDVKDIIKGGDNKR